MFKNYVQIALRTIKRNKISSLIAILGLTLGITSALLLYNYINYHFNYEDFMPKESLVKRLVSRRIDHFGNDIFYGEDSVTPDTVELIREKIKSIGKLTTIKTQGEMIYSVDNTPFIGDISFVEKNFFQMIPFPVIQGNRESLLTERGTVVLEKKMADKHFPHGDAIGKVVQLAYGNGISLIVTGVIEIPINSHLYSSDSQAFIPGSFKDLIEDFPGDRVAVYFTPASSFDKNRLLEELQNLLPQIPENNYEKLEELLYEDFQTIHLFTKDFYAGGRSAGPLYLLILLMILTLSLLSISIINSVSILTAQSITRTKEVGVRLVMGSSKTDLILQFLTESLILTFLSLILALIFKELLQTSLSNLVMIELDYSYSPGFILFILFLTFTIGILAGLYPAFYLSSIRIVDSLKGKTLLKLSKTKKILLFTQFLFASVILVWTLSINNEMKYLQKMDPGFNSENLLVIFPGIDFCDEPYEKLLTLKNEILKVNGVIDVSYSNYGPFFGGGSSKNSYLSTDGLTEYFELFTYIESGYLKLLGIEPIEGQIKENSVVIMKSVNEYRDLHVGDLIELDSKSYNVSAIINDYYVDTPLLGKSAKFHIVTDTGFWFQLLRYSSDVDLKEMRKAWTSVFPERPVDYYFINVEEQNNPLEVKIIFKVMNITMFIILFLSSLGLFGLTLHMIKQKTKEIGIRKVLGADFISIIFQFYKESLSIIFTAVVIGIPIGVFTIKTGLILYDYPLPLHDLLKISLVSAITIIVTGTLFIGFMVVKSARANPSDALRYE